MSIGALGIGSYASWYQPAQPLPAPHGSSTAPSSADTSAAPSARPSSAALAALGVEGAGGAQNLSRSSSLAASVRTSESDGQQQSQQQDESQQNAGEPSSESQNGSSGETSRQSLAPPRGEADGGGQSTPTGLTGADDASPSTSTAANAGEASPAAGEKQPRQPQTERREPLMDGAAAASLGVSDRFWPLSTATMQTSVFDVVHVFSERGISSVPILDEDGVVLNLFETVDIVVRLRGVQKASVGADWTLPSRLQDLVRQNAYQVLDQTIEDALNQRSPDFTGVMTCTPSDTLASILAYVRDRRCHRFVIVEPEDVPARDGMPPRKKGSLVGLLSLSDVLRFIVGHENLKGMEVPGLGESRSLCVLPLSLDVETDLVWFREQECMDCAASSNSRTRPVRTASTVSSTLTTSCRPRRMRLRPRRRVDAGARRRRTRAGRAARSICGRRSRRRRCLTM